MSAAFVTNTTRCLQRDPTKSHGSGTPDYISLLYSLTRCNYDDETNLISSTFGLLPTKCLKLGISLRAKVEEMNKEPLLKRSSTDPDVHDGEHVYEVEVLKERTYNI